MSLPGVLWFLIFAYLPMWGIVIAFTRYNLFGGLFQSQWIGWMNFQQWFRDPYFFRLMRNTIVLNVYGLIFGFPAPIILALLLNEVRLNKFKRVVQTISYLPHFISTVVIVGMLKIFFSPGNSGIVNMFIKDILGMEAINFFARPEWFRTLFIGSGIWQGVGWGSIIYLAAISGISPELYESATIDGARRLQKIRYITIPCIAPTISILLILNVGGMLSIGFEKVYLMYSPATYETADVISTYVYRMGIQGGRFGFGAAVGLFNNIIAAFLLLFTNYSAKKMGNESLW